MIFSKNMQSFIYLSFKEINLHFITRSCSSQLSSQKVFHQLHTLYKINIKLRNTYKILVQISKVFSSSQWLLNASRMDCCGFYLHLHSKLPVKYKFRRKCFHAVIVTCCDLLHAIQYSEWYSDRCASEIV